MRSLYRKALRYAYVLDSQNQFDLVHNAFLYYYKKSNGGNLFEQVEPYVMRCVRYMWKWKYSNDTFNKQFIDFELSTNVTPLQLLESKEAVDQIYERVKSYPSTHPYSLKSSVLLEFLSFLERGYEVKEICVLMNISPQTASNYRKKLKQLILMQINNPFSGNLARPVKKISLKVYEEKYKDEYVCDFNREWCDENETAKLVVHKEREEYILVKIGKD